MSFVFRNHDQDRQDVTWCRCIATPSLASRELQSSTCMLIHAEFGGPHRTCKTPCPCPTWCETTNMAQHALMGSLGPLGPPQKWKAIESPLSNWILLAFWRFQHKLLCQDESDESQRHSVRISTCSKTHIEIGFRHHDGPVMEVLQLQTGIVAITARSNHILRFSTLNLTGERTQGKCKYHPIPSNAIERLKHCAILLSISKNVKSPPLCFTHCCCLKVFSTCNPSNEK